MTVKYSHRLPFIFVVQVGVGKCSLDKTAQHRAATATQSASSEHEGRDLARRFPVAKENYSLACDESVEEYDDGMSCGSIRMKVRVVWSRYERR